MTTNKRQFSKTTRNKQTGNQIAKHWYQSKTVWFNAVTALAYFGGQFVPSLQPYMSEQVFVYVSGAVNIALRFVTNSAIKNWFGVK